MSRCLVGLDTCWNALLAPYTLGETLTFRRALGVIVILLGTICSALFANHDDTTWTVVGLENVLLTYRTFWYIVIFFSFTGFNYTAAMSSPKGSYRRGLALGLMAGSLAGNMWCVKATMSLLAESISHGAFTWMEISFACACIGVKKRSFGLVGCRRSGGLGPLDALRDARGSCAPIHYSCSS